MTTDNPAPDRASETPDGTRSRLRWLTRSLLAVGVIIFASFWIWALFFASKEAVNKIEDRQWAADAEQICAEAADDRLELADYTVLQDGATDQVLRRAELVDRSTATLETMLGKIESLELNGAKANAIVPDWLADYRVYVDDRYRYAEALRSSGENEPFYESTTSENLPITEKLATFAGDNEMPSCAPPRDLTR